MPTWTCSIPLKKQLWLTAILHTAVFAIQAHHTCIAPLNATTAHAALSRRNPVMATNYQHHTLDIQALAVVSCTLTHESCNTAVHLFVPSLPQGWSCQPLQAAVLVLLCQSSNHVCGFTTTHTTWQRKYASQHSLKISNPPNLHNCDTWLKVRRDEPDTSLKQQYTRHSSTCNYLIAVAGRQCTAHTQKNQDTLHSTPAVIHTSIHTTT
jgi:hypothetical protein